MSHSTPPIPNGQALSLRSKAGLRAEMRQRLAELSPVLRQTETEVLNAELVGLLAATNWESVLAFWADGLEPELTTFYSEAYRQDIPLAFPRLTAAGSLDYRVVSAEGPWEVHEWGIRQPRDEASIWKTSGGPVLLLVPGVAFDPEGGRLGRGKGFFDRYLADRPRNLTVLGVGWSVQLVTKVPTAAHDQRLDGLLLGGNSAILTRGVHLWH